MMIFREIFLFISFKLPLKYMLYLVTIRAEFDVMSWGMHRRIFLIAAHVNDISSDSYSPMISRSHFIMPKISLLLMTPTS